MRGGAPYGAGMSEAETPGPVERDDARGDLEQIKRGDTPAGELLRWKDTVLPPWDAFMGLSKEGRLGDEALMAAAKAARAALQELAGSPDDPAARAGVAAAIRRFRDEAVRLVPCPPWTDPPEGA